MSKLWNHKDYILVMKEKIQSLVADQSCISLLLLCMQFEDHLRCSLTQNNSQLGSVKNTTRSSDLTTKPWENNHHGNQRTKSHKWGSDELLKMSVTWTKNSNFLIPVIKGNVKKKKKKDSHLPIKSDLYFVSLHSAVPIQKYVLIVFLVYTSLK